MDSEHAGLETVAELLSVLRRDEMKRAFGIGREDANGSRATMQTHIPISQMASHIDVDSADWTTRY
jgi:hypothetical protein